MNNGIVSVLRAVAMCYVVAEVSSANGPHPFAIQAAAVGEVVDDPAGDIYLIDGKSIPYAFSIRLDAAGEGMSVRQVAEACMVLKFQLVCPSKIRAMECLFVVERPYYVMTSEMSMRQAAAIESKSIDRVRNEAMTRLTSLREGDLGFAPQLEQAGSGAIDAYLANPDNPLIGMDCSYSARLCRLFFDSHHYAMAIPTLSQWLICAGVGEKDILDAIPSEPTAVGWGTSVTDAPEQMLKYVLPVCGNGQSGYKVNNMFGNVSEYVLLSPMEKELLCSAIRDKYGEGIEKSLFYEDKIVSTIGLSVGGDVMTGAGFETREEAWTEFRKPSTWNVRDITGLRRVEGGSVLWTDRIIATGFRPIIACPRGEFTIVREKK